MDDAAVRQAFGALVNMGREELLEWLSTDESRKVGWRGSDGQAPESVGHASGRRIAEMLGKCDSKLTADDLAHMRKVVGFIRRHSAQRPDNIYTSRWRYSLMNWGHDPTKEEA